MPTDIIERSPSVRRAGDALPAGLHHAAYVSADQERTRRFYEDALGFPLVAFWIEAETVGGRLHEFSHAFYGLADGSALAFFNFADPELQERYKARKQELFVHLALRVDAAQQAAMRQRLEESELPFQDLDHGYCRSLYVEDPDGQMIEFCADADDIDSVNARQLRIAHGELARWMTGDRTSNNHNRPGE